MTKSAVWGMFALGVLLFVSGCSNHATATISPGADLNRVKSFYVVHQPKDSHNLHNLIRDRLTKDGFAAEAGPELPQSAYKADAVVTHVDRRMCPNSACNNLQVLR